MAEGNRFTERAAAVGDTLPYDLLGRAKRRILAAELLQFAAAGAAFVVLAVIWLFVVFLPGRTLERWEDGRPGRGGEGGGRGR